MQKIGEEGAVRGEGSGGVQAWEEGLLIHQAGRATLGDGVPVRRVVDLFHVVVVVIIILDGTLGDVFIVVVVVIDIFIVRDRI